jgi:hypothetical protein
LGKKSTIDFDQSDDWSRVLSFFYDQNRFSGDPDRGDVGVWAPLARADDWTCDSQSVVDFAKWRQNRRFRAASALRRRAFIHLKSSFAKSVIAV